MIYAVFGDVLSLIQKGLLVVSPLFLYRNIYSSLIKWAYVIHIREVSIFVFIIDIYIYIWTFVDMKVIYSFHQIHCRRFICSICPSLKCMYSTGEFI